jgi:hypothetical protein
MASVKAMTETVKQRPAILVIDDHEQIKRLPLRDLVWRLSVQRLHLEIVRLKKQLNDILARGKKRESDTN